MILKDLSQDDLSTFVDVLESRQDEYFANSVTSLVDNVKDVPISKPEIRYLMGESLPLPRSFRALDCFQLREDTAIEVLGIIVLPVEAQPHDRMKSQPVLVIGVP